jgi:WD40 repeat protein
LLVLCCAASNANGVRPQVSPELILRRGNASQINALALFARGELLASTSHDGTFLWDVHTGRMLRRISSDGTGTLGFSNDGKYLLDGRRLYEVRTGRVLRALDVPTECRASFSASPDGRWLAAVAAAGTRFAQATLWDIRSRTFATHRFAVRDMGVQECPTARVAEFVRSRATTTESSRIRLVRLSR